MSSGFSYPDISEPEQPWLRLVLFIYLSWINKYQKILRTPDVRWLLKLRRRD